jgi:serine/threonine protein phosphatase PrpC
MAFALGAAIVSIRPASTLMESAAKGKKTVESNNNNNNKRREVHSYGSPLLPQDVYYDPKVKAALADLRTLKREEVVEDKETGFFKKKKGEDSLKVLDTSGRKEAGTLTLIGYKGGPLESQINQDRAFCIVPYTVNTEPPTRKRRLTSWGREQSYPAVNRLIGVFDGHANLGEVVSQYVVSELPKLLASKLKGLEGTTSEISKALIDTFVELDAKAPAEISGGCTASVVFQHGPKVYFANAGDSRSFLVVYREKTASVEMIYVTREDKPDLQDERERVESRGGQVYLPLRGTSRVLYTDPVTGMQSGLAMSRSIGDWEVGKLGVIPDPIVHVVDIPELVQAQLDPSEAKKAPSPNDDDVYIFAVSATDGMMDFISPEAIGHAVALSLYAKDGPHLLTTLEQLIYIAAQRWEQSKQGRYRDDIAIAVSQLRIPTDGQSKQ